MYTIPGPEKNHMVKNHHFIGFQYAKDSVCLIPGTNKAKDTGELTEEGYLGYAK